MKGFLLLSAVFVLQFLVSGNVPAAILSNSDIQKIVRENIENRRSTAIVVGVVDSSGSRVFAAGKLNGDSGSEVDGHSVFEIGSVTKTFTALLLEDMVQRGEVRLEDPVAKHLPKSVKTPSRNGKEITLLDLATQSSGLPRMPDNFVPRDPDNPYSDYTEKRMYDFLNNYTLTNDIGAGYEYSNLGFALLGRALSLRAGKEYEALVRERILKPLGMGETGIALNPHMKSGLATGHNQMLQPVKNWDFDVMAPAGAVVSTVDDMLRYASAHLGLTETPLFPAMRETMKPCRDTAIQDNRIGLAWHVQKKGETEITWHNGATGGYHSLVALDRAHGVGVVILSASVNGIEDIGFHILDPAAYPISKYTAPREHKEAKVDPKIFDAFTGFFELVPDMVITITREKDKLYGQLTGQEKIELHPESETDYFIVEVDAQVSFVREPDGAVNRLVLHQNGQDHEAKRIKEYTPKKHTEVKVDPKLFDAYAGRYELTPGFFLTITKEGDKLFLQATGQSKVQLHPESETGFFLKEVEATVTFEREPDGAVNRLVLHQSGQHLEGKRK